MKKRTEVIRFLGNGEGLVSVGEGIECKDMLLTLRSYSQKPYFATALASEGTLSRGPAVSQPGRKLPLVVSPVERILRESPLLRSNPYNVSGRYLLLRIEVRLVIC